MVNLIVESYYTDLKKTLNAKGYSDNLIVISTKRFNFGNKLLTIFSVAASKSRHLRGEAFDFIVLDVNSDGKINSEDVDIVYKILDDEIVQDEGGIGTYKNQNLLSQQMIHIDNRGFKARWEY